MNEPDAVTRVEMPERTRAISSGTANGSGMRASSIPAEDEKSNDYGATLMDEILQRDNLVAAYRRVKYNDGAPGIDGMTVDDLTKLPRSSFTQAWGEIRNGTYQPQAVRRVEIPKPDGRGTRMLGIPTVMDRLIQQAVLQRLQPMFDPLFSE
jgi:retron-type reverse transcriptase